MYPWNSINARHSNKHHITVSLTCRHWSVPQSWFLAYFPHTPTYLVWSRPARVRVVPPARPALWCVQPPHKEPGPVHTSSDHLHADKQTTSENKDTRAYERKIYSRIPLSRAPLTRGNQLVALGPWTPNFSDSSLAAAHMTERLTQMCWSEQISPLVHSSQATWQPFNLSHCIEMHNTHLLGHVG